ncbi:uncharacterized protein LOC144089457 isoform X2 [Stigmatopora argus]
MSNRDSLGFGDLVPRDVVEIFAHEKHHKKGRKKRSRSLGRALGWLKGKKRKDQQANGHNPGLGPALDLALDRHVAAAAHLGRNKAGRQTLGNSHGSLNLKDDKTPPPPLLQENVFIEASRPKYLEDLHSEALEGLKMMQQEENNAGVEFRDNESTTSTMTAQTDGEGFTSDSTIASSVVSMQSSTSTRSSRSGLTRQGSTFRPLNSGKPSEKGRMRRRHRKTAASIPRHVQREFGLDRAGRPIPSKMERQDRLHGGRVVRPVDEEEEEELTQSIGADDDLALLRRLDKPDEGRPWSLSFPWAGDPDALQRETSSPVMSMSPQAAYMSKIIPNAVLPPSIEVVEISRGQSRNSLRTLSKSSLLLASPSPSRASGRSSSSKVSSAYRRNPYDTSDASGRSFSGSSETLVSDSSTISDGNVSAKAPTGGRRFLVAPPLGDGETAPFGRSLSVTKPKRAPAPPSRSYSLHNKMKRRSRDFPQAVDPSPQSDSTSGGGAEHPEAPPPVDSPGYNGDVSSLDDSTGSALFRANKLPPPPSDSAHAGKRFPPPRETWPPEKKVVKVTSPSSGYSSQDCVSPPFAPSGSSPKRKRGILAKLQKLFPGTSTPSVHSETKKIAIPPKGPPSPVEKGDSRTTKPSVKTLRDLFDIPPHPKVHAPPAPPPEVWAHSKRTFELLLGPPAPDDVYAIIKKNPKDRRPLRPWTDGAAAKTPAGDGRQKNPTEVEEGPPRNESETRQIGRAAPGNADSDGNGHVTKNDEKVRASDVLNGMLAKAAERREERLAGAPPESTARRDPLRGVRSTRASPSPPPAHFPPEPPGKRTAEVNEAASPSSWLPPPPPPTIQASGIPDEFDFPLPPPPLTTEALPASSPPPPVPSPAAIVERRSVSTTPTIIVTMEPEPVNSTTSPPVPPPLSIPPPPTYAAPLPPTAPAADLTKAKEVIPSPPPMTQPVSPPPPKVVPAALAPEPSPPMVRVAPPSVQVTEDPPAQVSQPVPAPPLQDIEEEETLASKRQPPPSIPPPPPAPSEPLTLEAVLEHQSILPEPQPVCNGILGPPQSIPPPPPLELLPPADTAHPNADGPHLNETPISSESSTPSPEPAPPPPASIPAPPPLPVPDLESLSRRPANANASAQKETPELSPGAVREEPTPAVTPSLLQTVKLRPVNGAPKPPPPPTEEPPRDEEVAQIQVLNGPAQNPPTNSEAPQKPVRRSLIIPSSPPADDVPSTPPPAPPKSPAAISTSPAPSMNLQEAIRLRTAARSRDVSVPRLGTPKDSCPSPTRTASFVFSKSKKMAMDPTTFGRKNQHEEAESPTKMKMPPPVAKKPKSKAGSVDCGDGLEQTAGQPVQTQCIMDAAKKSNGADEGSAGGGET